MKKLMNKSANKIVFNTRKLSSQYQPYKYQRSESHRKLNASFSDSRVHKVSSHHKLRSSIMNIS